MTHDDPTLPLRPSAGHKGTFGTVSVFGGCSRGDVRMIGAPSLSALGALRAGCGLAKLVMPAPVLEQAMGIVPSATGVALPVDEQGAIVPHEASAEVDRQCAASSCVIVGPGLGDGVQVEALALRAVMQDGVPVVVDADALNALARIPEFWRDFRAPAILTPHPGEFARLAKVLGITPSPTDPAARPAAAESLAQRLGCIVVLKGEGTVVSSGYDTWTCGAGHPCLGTAGTGDVLAGVIAGIVAQHVRTGLSLFNAARAGVLAHARAGEAWAAQARASGGMLATDLAALVPAEVERLRRG